MRRVKAGPPGSANQNTALCLTFPNLLRPSFRRKKRIERREKEGRGGGRDRRGEDGRGGERKEEGGEQRRGEEMKE